MPTNRGQLHSVENSLSTYSTSEILIILARHRKNWLTCVQVMLRTTDTCSNCHKFGTNGHGMGRFICAKGWVLWDPYLREGKRPFEWRILLKSSLNASNHTYSPSSVLRNSPRSIFLRYPSSMLSVKAIQCLRRAPSPSLRIKSHQ